MEQVHGMVRVKESEAINSPKPISCMANKEGNTHKIYNMFSHYRICDSQRVPQIESQIMSKWNELGSWESLERAKETYKIIYRLSCPMVLNWYNGLNLDHQHN